MLGFVLVIPALYMDSGRAMKIILIGLIRIYQLTLSAFVGRRCRYLPTCSDYSKEAIERFGAYRGSILALSRITRCHPWGGEGFDPVPERYEDKRKGGHKAPQ
jgi:uncharacterized protein